MSDTVLDTLPPRRLLERLRGGRSLALWVTLVVRTLGGLAGALPPLVAVGFVSRTQYGLATANYALALLLIGPISQFVSLGYMREVVGDLGRIGGATRPVGTAAIYLYAFALLVVLALVGMLGYGSTDAALTAALAVLAMGARLQEIHLVAAGRQLTAIVLFYVLPPALICTGVVGLRLGTSLDDFAVVSAAQLIAYGVTLLASLAGPDGRPHAMLPPRLPRTSQAWRAEAAAVWVFLGNGVVLSAADQAPTLMLRAFGLAGAIPHFEIARKAGSVPSLMAHAFSMQLGPRLVATADARDWPGFRGVLRGYVGLLVGLTAAYVAVLLAGLWWLHGVPAVASRVDPWLFTALLGSGLVTAVAAPVGAAVIALRAERWFLAGPVLSLALQLAVAWGLYGTLGSLAIALGLLAQNLFISAVAMAATVSVLRRREAA